MAEEVTSSTIPSDYAARVKQYRARLGLTQAELAARLGVSFSTVNRWENGQTKPSSLAWQQLVRLTEGETAIEKREIPQQISVLPVTEYGTLVSGISGLLEQTRRETARSVNATLTATYWEIGRRIVEHEQGGKARAEYGEELLTRLTEDLTAKYGRGFSKRNLEQMRIFYQGREIAQTPSAQFEARVICPEVRGGIENTSAIVRIPSAHSPIFRTAAGQLSPLKFAEAFPLSWSHYTRLMSVEKPHARAFYEAESIHGGWSVRQLDRQIGTQFFERMAKSKQQAAMLARGRPAKPEDAVTADEEIRDPYLLEFLNLKDEFSESDLEEALIRHLEWFLLELGPGFAFVARQKRIRVGNTWYLIDLLLYHRVLRCMVIIDLKRGHFTHADAGQMNLYLNYVKEHLTLPGEADPIGIILCSARDEAVVKYAMGGINANVFASRYMTELPDPETLRQEIVSAQHTLESIAAMKGKRKS